LKKINIKQREEKREREGNEENMLIYTKTDECNYIFYDRKRKKRGKIG
jgi:hypothetical protein